jgi:adenosylmethionine---8-amino-7-oxononanoate aminotransferase
LRSKQGGTVFCERSPKRIVPSAMPTLHHWLPFTQMSSFDARAFTFVRASGTKLVDAREREIFDAISSVWTTIHGHCHPAIADAIARQAAVLDHVTALGATHPVAEELAGRLAALTGLDYAFFSSDGASAIEVALKIALKYWHNAGDGRRTRFARLVDAYHGDTAGAMSVSAIEAFKSPFGPICFDALTYDRLGEVLERDDLAAVVVEPTVQAAAGMRIVERSAYEPLRGNRMPLLVVDEIATGFGRTGPMFAFSQLGLQPDMLCLGKGLTGGTIALSATLATERIYRAFLGDPDEDRHLFHGHSYAANPIACAAALASLDLFETERTLENVTARATDLDAMLTRVSAHPHVRDVRRAGLMCGIELDERDRARRTARGLYDRGHFTRPIGSVVQLVPPLCSTSAELSDFVDALLSELNG